MSRAEVEPEREDASATCDCPRLDPEEWHEVESDWSDVSFLRAGIPAVFGVPVGYGTARHKLVAKANAEGFTIPGDAMVLIGPGGLRRPLWLEVEAPEGTKGIERPGGFVFSRLLPARMGQMKKMVADTVEIARKRYQRKPDRVWMWYLTCAVCSAPRDFETLIIAQYKAR
jgi:hypothetical protein